MSEADSDINQPSTSSGIPKKRNPENWTKNVVKKQRNLGQEYTSLHSGKVVKSRSVGPPCSDGCFDKIPALVRESVFEKFWELGDYALQNAYITKHVHVVPVKRRRKPRDPNNPKQRPYNLQCTVTYSGITYIVCNKGFLGILGIGRGRLDSAVRGMTPTDTTPQDRRGRQVSGNKIPDATLALVHQHIDSFPTVTSHYTRAKSPNLRYLDTHLSIDKMYHLYVLWMKDNHPNERVVKESFYRKVFHTKNLSFKPPKTDTCSKCDSLKTAIQLAEHQNAEDDKATLEEELQAHTALARRGQQLMNDMGMDPNDDTRIICFDLQQTLPIPRLSTNVAYYKRKIWMYNLCISNMKTGKNTFYVWDEVTGGRGSIEVVSCLKKWITEEYDRAHFEKLVVFSDNCGSQNKNLNIMLSYLEELHSKRLQEVTHYYLITGHSYMPCDRAFGHIEKNIRKSAGIYNFEGYCKLIETAVHASNLVIRMQRSDFLNYDALQGHITHWKPRRPLLFSGCRRLCFKLQFREGYQLSQGYDDPLQSVRLMPGRSNYKPSSFDLSKVVLTPKYQAPIKLNPEKVRDIDCLLQHIRTSNKDYYVEIFRAQGDITTEKPGQTEEEDVDNDLLDYDEA